MKVKLKQLQNNLGCSYTVADVLEDDFVEKVKARYQLKLKV